VARLAKIENIVGVKEASGNIGQMAAVLNAVPGDFSVLSGDDSVTLPLFALGGRGVISVAANEIPREMAQLCECGLAGDFFAARAIQKISRADGNQFCRVKSDSSKGGDEPDGIT